MCIYIYIYIYILYIKLYIYNLKNIYILDVQKSSMLFFVKFNLYSKTNKKILISEIFPVCFNDLLPSFG